jgi:WD40 repeat protein
LKDGDSGLLGSSGFAVQSPAQRQDVATGQQIGSPLIGNPLSVAINTVNSVAFSPDGKILATGSVDGTVRLWNVAAATGRQIRSLRTADPYGPTWVAFSPHGKTLATDSFSFIPATHSSRGTARLWNVATGQQIGQPDKVNLVDAVAFSPDGKTLATGSLDGTARLLDVTTGQPISGRLAADIAKVNSGVDAVAFSPDGKTLAAGSTDGTARLWNVGYLADVLGQLCSRIGGSLTRAEWAKYVPAGPAYQNVCR